MEEKIEDILDNNMMYDGQLNKTKAITELLNLFSVSKSVVCGNCDGWGYTVYENGRRKEHCKECE